MRNALKLAAFSTALLVAATASAQEEYPNEVRNHLGLNYSPPCSLCHAKGNTGSGTVVTPFGWAIRGRGAVADDRKTIDTALDSLKAANADSDGDHVTDIAELMAGTDPNTAGSVPLPNGEEPGYGCGGSAPDPNPRGAAIPPIVVVALWLARRSKRGGRS